MRDCKPPKIGDTYLLRGKTPCIVRRVYPFGTMDIETPDGLWFRVTGLPW